MAAVDDDQLIGDRLVVVARYQYVIQAQAAKLFLEEEGIPCVITGAEIVVADWGLGNAVGDIRVETMEVNAARAAEILSRMPAASTLGEHASAVSESDIETCLSCGSEFPPSATECPDCGWSFKSGDGDSPASSETAETSSSPVLHRFRWLAKIAIQIWVISIILTLLYAVIVNWAVR